MHKKILTVILSAGIALSLMSCSYVKIPLMLQKTETAKDKTEKAKEEDEEREESRDEKDTEDDGKNSSMNSEPEENSRDTDNSVLDAAVPEYDQERTEKNKDEVSGINDEAEPEKAEQDLTTPQIDTRGTASYVGKEAEEALKKLDTDYNKVSWGVRYAPIEDLPGIIVSVAPAKEHNGVNGLIIAITNLYDEEISVAGGGTVKGLNGEDVGDFYLFADTIGTGSTFIRDVYCDGVPSGKIHWDSFETMETQKTFVSWEADWTIKERESGKPSVDYSIYADRPFKAGYIYGLLLDGEGNIVDIYSAVDYTETDHLVGSMDGYENPRELGASDLALFANPVAE